MYYLIYLQEVHDVVIKIVSYCGSSCRRSMMAEFNGIEYEGDKGDGNDDLMESETYISDEDMVCTDTVTFEETDISESDYHLDFLTRSQELEEIKMLNCQFMKAVVKHSAGRIRELLDDLDPFCRLALDYPQSILLAAIDLNDVGIVRVLIEHQADPNVGRHTDGKAVHIAALKGNVEILRLLDLAGAKCNTLAGMHGRHPLHVAVYWRRLACVKYFVLEKRCNANIRTKFSDETPLHLAAKNGDKEMVEFLLEHAAALVVDEQNYAPWMYASDGDFMEIVDLLLVAHGIDTVCEFTRKSALHFACRVSHHKYIKLLLYKGGDCNVQDTYGLTPLIEAIRHKNITVIWYLLEECPSLNINAVTIEGKTPLHYALELRISWQDKEPYLNILKSKGADPNISTDPNMPLLLEYIEDIDITRWLLCAGADPNICCPDGTTALTRAIATTTASWCPDKPSSLHLLLENNIDLNVSSILSPQGLSSLQEAILTGNPSLVIFLVHVGCSLNNISLWLNVCPHVEQLRSSIPRMEDLCQWLQDICKQPRCLAFLCRQPVLALLGHHRVRDKIDTLPIPNELKNFLVYSTSLSTL